VVGADVVANLVFNKPDNGSDNWHADRKRQRDHYASGKWAWWNKRADHSNDLNTIGSKMYIKP
jgi:hypothetical protein